MKGLLRLLCTLMGFTKIAAAFLALLGAILVQAAINTKYNWDLHYLGLYRPLQFTAAAGFIIFSYHFASYLVYGFGLDQKFQTVNWEKFELISCCICCLFALIGGITGIAVAFKDTHQIYLRTRGIYVTCMVGISMVMLSMIPTGIFYLVVFLQSMRRKRAPEYVDT